MVTELRHPVPGEYTRIPHHNFNLVSPRNVIGRLLLWWQDNEGEDLTGKDPTAQTSEQAGGAD